MIWRLPIIFYVWIWWSQWAVELFGSSGFYKCYWTEGIKFWAFSDAQKTCIHRFPMIVCGGKCFFMPVCFTALQPSSVLGSWGAHQLLATSYTGPIAKLWPLNTHQQFNFKSWCPHSVSHSFLALHLFLSTFFLVRTLQALQFENIWGLIYKTLHISPSTLPHSTINGQCMRFSLVSCSLSCYLFLLVGVVEVRNTCCSFFPQSSSSARTVRVRASIIQHKCHSSIHVLTAIRLYYFSFILVNLTRVMIELKMRI